MTIELNGLDGGNPLAFLAALGTLRGLSMSWGADNVRLAWCLSTKWYPVLQVNSASQSEVVSTLYDQLQAHKLHPTLHMADNLNMQKQDFRIHLAKQAALAEEIGIDEPTAFASAFGCDAIADDNNVMLDTALRTMSGAGHQHFLKTMREVLSVTSPEQIATALFHPWKYEDPLQGYGMRFDPLDDNRYAHRWADPSGDFSRGKRGNMLGANALAILGIPLLSTAPSKGRLETIGFRGRGSRGTFWTWPIWNVPLTLDVVRSVLALEELENLDALREDLAQRGIVAVFRSQRLTIGKFRNFTPSQAM